MLTMSTKTTKQTQGTEEKSEEISFQWKWPSGKALIWIQFKPHFHSSPVTSYYKTSCLQSAYNYKNTHGQKKNYHECNETMLRRRPWCSMMRLSAVSVTSASSAAFLDSG